MCVCERIHPTHFFSNINYRENSLVLLDFGCEYNGYASDITRTYPVSGKYTKEQKDVYNIVLEVNKHCIKVCIMYA